MSTELQEKPAKPKQMTIRDRLRDPAMIAEIGKVIPSHCTPERIARVALTAIVRTPKLAECSQESFFKCLLDLSAMGLEADGRRAHLIPYGTDCTLIVDYKGIVELAYRSGFVANIHADVVCENDIFECNLGEVTRHHVDYRQPRGKPFAAYCIVTLRDGTKKAEVMTRDEIEGVRSRSRAGTKGPWVTDWNEMAKKTVFRRVSKWIPLSAEIRDAVEHDDDGVIDAVSTPARTSVDDITALLASPAEREPGDEG